MNNIIFIAPPAAGKGTQSKFLEKKYNYVHLSTGNILRDEVQNNPLLAEDVKNTIKNGGLVSDEIIISILKSKFDSIKGKLFILDGFPRTMVQAKELTKILEELNINNYKVIFLDVDKDTAMKRTLGRLTCSCGKSYNKYFEDLKPSVDNICDECGKELFVRTDDTEEHFYKRFAEYLEKTKPIIDYYKSIYKIASVRSNYDDPKDAFEELENYIND